MMVVKNQNSQTKTHSLKLFALDLDGPAHLLLDMVADVLDLPACA